MLYVHKIYIYSLVTLDKVIGDKVEIAGDTACRFTVSRAPRAYVFLAIVLQHKAKENGARLKQLRYCHLMYYYTTDRHLFENTCTG